MRFLLWLAVAYTLALSFIPIPVFHGHLYFAPVETRCGYLQPWNISLTHINVSFPRTIDVKTGVTTFGSKILVTNVASFLGYLIVNAFIIASIIDVLNVKKSPKDAVCTLGNYSIAGIWLLFLFHLAACITPITLYGGKKFQIGPILPWYTSHPQTYVATTKLHLLPGIFHLVWILGLLIVSMQSTIMFWKISKKRALLLHWISMTATIEKHQNATL